VQEWLHYIATELHKGFAPLYGKIMPEEVKTAAREKLATRFAFLAAAVETQPYLTGQTFTVADGYAFYTLRVWKRVVRPELPSPALQPYFERILARPAVIAALDAERDT
jgi:glutathione S-transferase